MYYLLEGTPDGVHSVARNLRSDGVYLRSFPDGRVYAKIGKKHARLVARPDPDHGVVFKQVREEEVGAPLKEEAPNPPTYNCNNCGRQESNLITLADHIWEVHHTMAIYSDVIGDVAPETVPEATATLPSALSTSKEWLGYMSREAIATLAIELRTQGWKWRDIGRKLGYPYTTLITWVKKYFPGVIPPRPSPRRVKPNTEEEEVTPPLVTYSPTPYTSVPELNRPHLPEIARKLQNLCIDMYLCTEELANEVKRLEAFFIGEVNE